MPRTVRRTAILGVISAVLGFADSVTWIDQNRDGSPANRTLNGTVTKRPEGRVTLEAQFASGPKTYPILSSNVRSIEINNVTFNPGAPPQPSALGEGPKAQPSPSKRPLVADAVELRSSGGGLEPCKLLSIDEKIIACEAADKGKPKEYMRTIVLRIVVRGDQ